MLLLLAFFRDLLSHLTLTISDIVKKMQTYFRAQSHHLIINMLTIRIFNLVFLFRSLFVNTSAARIPKLHNNRSCSASLRTYRRSCLRWCRRYRRRPFRQFQRDRQARLCRCTPSQRR